ncbi:hypothetical protein LSH36_80g06064, partial [Paralvinella palmiformis]
MSRRRKSVAETSRNCRRLLAAAADSFVDTTEFGVGNTHRLCCLSECQDHNPHMHHTITRICGQLPEFLDVAYLQYRHQLSYHNM